MSRGVDVMLDGDLGTPHPAGFESVLGMVRGGDVTVWPSAHRKGGAELQLVSF